MTKEQTNEILIAKRIFPITGRLENGIITEMEKALFQMCLENQKEVANLVIDSGGGNVTCALSGYDFIKSLPFPVDCTIIGDCHSATLTLISACDRRKATKHSRFLFHAMSFNPEYKSTEDMEEQMRIRLGQHKILFEQCLKVQSDAYGISVEELIKMREQGERFDVRLTAQEALEKKIIHEIVEKFDFYRPMG
jgi:ATP-dependent protease ClpP protease subunit